MRSSMLSLGAFSVALIAGALSLSSCGDSSGERLNGPVQTGVLAGSVMLDEIVPIRGVKLLVERGSLALSTSSDDEGRFTFTDLEPGAWQLGITPPQGMALASGLANPMTIEMPERGGLQLTLQLATDQGTGSLVVQVLADTLDPGTGEPFQPVGGVLVKVTGPGDSEVIRADSSGDNGLAVFALPAGTYVVEIELPSGWEPFPGTSARYESVLISEGESTSLEFKITGSGGGGTGTSAAIVGTTVLNDLERLAGVSVEVQNGDTRLSQVTDASGVFTFGDLERGTWTISFTPPDGFVLAADEPAQRTIELAAGDTLYALNVSFGRDDGTGVLLASVWSVADSARVSDVLIQVFESGSDVVVASQRTGGSGQSLFSLDPGTYDAEVEVPAGYALPPGAAKRQGGLIIRSGHATFTGFDLTGDGA